MGEYPRLSAKLAQRLRQVPDVRLVAPHDAACIDDARERSASVLRRLCCARELAIAEPRSLSCDEAGAFRGREQIEDRLHVRVDLPIALEDRLLVAALDVERRDRMLGARQGRENLVDDRRLQRGAGKDGDEGDDRRLSLAEGAALTNAASPTSAGPTTPTK